VERLPPQNIEAERSVLGAVLLSSDAIHYAINILGPSASSWYTPAHQAIWGAMLYLHDANRAIDLVTLGEALGPKLDSVGGYGYIAELTNAVPTSANVEYYATIVKETAFLRAIASTGMRLHQLAFEQGADAKRVKNEAEVMLFDLFRSEQRNGAMSIGDVIDRVLASYESEAETGISRVIPTGIRELDRYIGGWRKGGLCIIGARPSVGKSSFALFSALNIARRGVAVQFFSIEMSQEDLTERLLLMNGGTCGRLASNWSPAKEHEINSLRQAGEAVRGLPLHIDDDVPLSLMDIRSRSRSVEYMNSERVIFIDYLQLMETPGLKMRYEELGDVSRGLKCLAKELRCPIVALVQLKREMDKLPSMASIRESGNIEQDADQIVLLHPLTDEGMAAERKRLSDRGMHLNVGNVFCLIEKHRQGQTGDFYVNFDKPTQRFSSPMPAGVTQVARVGVYDDNDRFDQQAEAHEEEQEDLF
jgi:replicative DNA helicase